VTTWTVGSTEAPEAGDRATDGIAPVLGGRHPGGGTRNALIAPGADSYLEIVGPDDDLAEQRYAERERSDGIRLSWQLIDPDPLVADGSLR